MSNSFFEFKQFIVHHDKSAMKVTTDACLFGAWVASNLSNATEKKLRILDIGAGTGLLALMIAQKINAEIDAIEIERDAADQASGNFINSPWADQLKLICDDVKKMNLPGSYDVIVSNPPFYSTDLKSENIKKNIAHHGDGLTLPELMTIVDEQIKEDGFFYLLLPSKSKPAIEAIALAHQFFLSEIVVVRPTAAHSPTRLMLKGSRIKTGSETRHYELHIKDEDGNYTAAFTSLLEDYYLHL